MDIIQQTYIRSTTINPNNIQILCGLGGIGKTQVALEYAYRQSSDYQYLIWVEADNAALTDSTYHELIRLLGIPVRDADDMNEVREVARRWLSNESGYLLIFDNADHPETLKPFIPINPLGHILITSRDRNFDLLQIASTPMELKSFEPEESKSFLLARTRRVDNDSAESEAIRALAEELGHLPLALEQAAAYIAKHEETFADYLEAYRRLRLTLLDQVAPVIGGYPLSVRTTWKRSFEAIQAQYPASAALLRVSAFFAPDRIPYVMVLQGAAEMGEQIADALAPEFDVHSLTKLLTPLAEHSLVHRDPRTGAFDIHRLVQLVLRDELVEADRLDQVKKSVRALNRSLPDAAFSGWPRYQHLIAHVLAAAEWIETEALMEWEAGRVLNYAANLHSSRAEFSRAKHLCRRALRTALHARGRNSLEVSDSLGGLATIFEHQG